MPDVVGIGALNVDLIATASRLKHLTQGQYEEITGDFEHGTEQPVSSDTIDQILVKMGLGTFQVVLGGSSFNTLQVMSSLGLSCSFGYIGIEGSNPYSAHSFKTRMKSLHLDSTFVHESKSIAGRCVSVISKGERSLRTCPGANTEFAGYLTENSDRIVEYLSSTRLIHITSFFDDSSAKPLADILYQVKARNPWVRFSFDPGHHWVESNPIAVHKIYELSDYLFLNYHEFCALSHFYGRDDIDDRERAKSIFQYCNTSTVLIVVKRYDLIQMYFYLGETLLCQSQQNVVLPDSEIEDATGAGDVFAAGFLGAQLVPNLELRHAVSLALRLVHSKLRTAGALSAPRASNIFLSYVEEVCEQEGEMAQTNRISKSSDAISQPIVFLGHGHSGDWMKVREFLEKRLGCHVRYYEEENRSAKGIQETLNSVVADAEFAVIVCSGDDEVAGVRQPRPNAIHEAGAMQQKLGNDKVAILYDEGTELPNNFQGLRNLCYRKTSISDCFHELQEHMEREGVLRR